MAESAQKQTEREYVIPLRREWMKVARYKRARRGVNTIRAFIAKHMKVPERDEKKVKLDKYLNNEVWFRGAKSPPAKIKVVAKKEGDNVIVELVDVPEKWKFAKEKHERWHRKAEKKAPKIEEKKPEEKTEEQKKEEQEKEKSVAQAREKQASMQAKADKHIVQAPKASDFQHRKSLKK